MSSPLYSNWQTGDAFGAHDMNQVAMRINELATENADDYAKPVSGIPGTDIANGAISMAKFAPDALATLVSKGPAFGVNLASDPNAATQALWLSGLPGISTGVISTEQASSGTTSLKTTMVGNTWGIIDFLRNSAGSYTTFSTGPGEMFTASAKVRRHASNTGTASVWIQYNFSDSTGVTAGTNLNGSAVTPTSSGWTTFSHSIVVPAGYDTVRIWAVVNQTGVLANDVFYWDEMVFKQERIREYTCAFGQAAVDTGVMPVPPNISGCRVKIINAGHGGGSGRKGAGGTVRGGGGAAAPVMQNETVIPAAAFTEGQWRLHLFPPGAGGASVTTADTNGNAGSASSQSCFRFSNVTGGGGNEYRVNGLTWSGMVGAGGTTAGGAAGNPVPTIGVTSGAGGAGAIGGSGTQTFNPDSAAGSGGGGGISAANTAFPGGPPSTNWAHTAGLVGVGGTVDGAVPTAGVANANRPGNGAGGGAASNTTHAQAGADGLGYGVGGGGGGASNNSFNSGRGGNGGPAYARIEWLY